MSRCIPLQRVPMADLPPMAPSPRESACGSVAEEQRGPAMMKEKAMRGPKKSTTLYAKNRFGVAHNFFFYFG